MTADNGVANAKYYGDVDARPMTVSDEGNAYKRRFVVTDTDGANQVKLAGVGATFYEVRGIISNKAGIKNGHAGTTALPYSDGDVVGVRIRGNVQVEAVATSGIVDGSPIIVGADGKAALFVAPTALGDTSGATDLADDIEAYIEAYNTIVGIASSVPDSNVVISMDFIRRG